MIGVRKDIALSCGKIAVQVAHAAVECAFALRASDSSLLRKWRAEGGKKVVVWVEDIEEIHGLELAAQRMGITAEIIRDAGATEVPPGTITCIGLGPAQEEMIDQLTRDLPLLTDKGLLKPKGDVEADEESDQGSRNR